MVSSVKFRFTNIYKFIIAFLLLLVTIVLAGSIKVSADEDEGSEWIHYHGITTERVNVRSGPGQEYDVITDNSKEKIQLPARKELIILGEAEATTGIIWYNIRFELDGETYEGFSTSSYVSKQSDKEPITPSPTPEPTSTPTPEPTKAEEPSATPTPTVQLLPEDDGKSNDKGFVKIVIVAVVVLLILFFGAIIAYTLLKNRKKGNNAASRKVEKLKATSINNNSGRKLPQIKRIEDEESSDNVRADLYYKKTYDSYDSSAESRMMSLYEQESDDKKELRAAIDRLVEHDIVYHTIYGEGEVFDNSDVKLIEIRFGNDMRFLKKDQIVARQEIRIIDEEDQSVARRRKRTRKN